MQWLRQIPISTILALMCVGLASIIVGIFAAETYGASAGEIFEGLGCVIGSAIGAAAAIGAVYFTLDGQRGEESQKVNSSLKVEIMTFTKQVAGALELCIQVHNGLRSIPTVDASYIVSRLPNPTVFPAVADRISLLHNPETAIEFYARIEEAKGIAKSIQTAFALTSTGAEKSLARIQRNDVLPLADCLITTLQLAHHAIQNADRLTHRRSSQRDGQLSTQVTVRTLKYIEEVLESAQNVFPEALSFKESA